jgi:hypothetical protein
MRPRPRASCEAALVVITRCLVRPRSPTTIGKDPMLYPFPRRQRRWLPAAFRLFVAVVVLSGCVTHGDETHRTGQHRRTGGLGPRVFVRRSLVSIFDRSIFDRSIIRRRPASPRLTAQRTVEITASYSNSCFSLSLSTRGLLSLRAYPNDRAAPPAPCHGRGSSKKK